MLQPSLFQKPIPIAPEYQIDIFGRVFLNEKLQSTWIMRDGYFYVRIRRCLKALHRMVLFAFVGAPPTPKHEACHRDGDRFNNCWTNLTWGTRADNTADKFRHGTTQKKPGMGGVKLSYKQIIEIKKLAIAGKIEPKDIAQQFQISTSHTRRIMRGECWTNIQLTPPRKRRSKSAHVQLELPLVCT